MFTRMKQAAHAVDHAMGRLGARRRVLVELRTPLSKAVLAPVYEALAATIDADVWFTADDEAGIIQHVGRRRFLTHRQAEWRRFDLYMNSDPWGAAALRRCAARVNFFHGVAGKYDLDDPSGLPLGFERYDRVAFINSDRMARYLRAGVVTEKQARLVGYPKLDRLASGLLDGTAVRQRLGFDGGRRVVLYAPTFSPESSLHLAGEAIVQTLAGAGYGVIVKLHDRSLVPDARYTGGIDWRQRMTRLERKGSVAFVEAADASDLLAAAHLLVTDHSSIGFEYLVLDRPLVVFDAPRLVTAARINQDKVALLRSAARVVRRAEDLPAACAAELSAPERLSLQRRAVSERMFHEPGTATSRAVSVLLDLLRSRPRVAIAAAL